MIYLNFSKNLVLYFIMAPKTRGCSKSSFCEDKKEIKIQWNDKDIEALIDFYNNKFVESKKITLKASIEINVLHMLINLRKKVI